MNICQKYRYFCISTQITLVILLAAAHCNNLLVLFGSVYHSILCISHFFLVLICKQAIMMQRLYIFKDLFCYYLHGMLKKINVLQGETTQDKHSMCMCVYVGQERNVHFVNKRIHLAAYFWHQVQQF